MQHPLGPRRRRGRPARASAAAVPQAASTRDQILAAAYRTLVDLGYNQISMRKIAEEARVNPSLLHYYYGSKENLMLEVLEYVNEQHLARQRKMSAEVQSFEAIWASALEYFKADVQSGYVRALWELRAQGLSNARIKKRLQQIIAGWRGLIVDLVRNALIEYRIDARVAPEVLARMLGDIYWGAEVEILEGEDLHLHIDAIRLMGNLFRWMAMDQQRAAAG